jgi:hypothetical protein
VVVAEVAAQVHPILEVRQELVVLVVVALAVGKELVLLLLVQQTRAVAEEVDLLVVNKRLADRV